MAPWSLVGVPLASTYAMGVLADLGDLPAGSGVSLLVGVTASWLDDVYSGQSWHARGERFGGAFQIFYSFGTSRSGRFNRHLDCN